LSARGGEEDGSQGEDWQRLCVAVASEVKAVGGRFLVAQFVQDLGLNASAPSRGARHELGVALVASHDHHGHNLPRAGGLVGNSHLDAEAFHGEPFAEAHPDHAGTAGRRLWDRRSTAPMVTGSAAPGRRFHVGARTQDANDRAFYNVSTGALLYDTDGSGAAEAIRFATLPGG
jgi:hypothetical protein